MGWLFPYHTTTKKLLVEDVLSHWKDNGEIHATKSCKSGLWILCTPKGYDHKIIGLYLMEKQQGLWGYKDLDESSHPYYYDCPVKWLDEAPVANQAWRDGVAEYNKKKLEVAAKQILINTHYKVGGSWRMGNIPVTKIYVTSTKPLRGLADGREMRIPRKMKEVMEPV